MRGLYLLGSMLYVSVSTCITSSRIFSLKLPRIIVISISTCISVSLYYIMLILYYLVYVRLQLQKVLGGLALHHYKLFLSIHK